MRNVLTWIAAALLVLCMTACDGNPSAGPGNEAEPSSSGMTSAGIRLNGASAETDAEGVTVNGSVITITAPGTYEISGKLENGQLLVETNGEVTLILMNAEIFCENSAPIYVKSAKQVTITLAEGSSNVLQDGGAYQTDAAGEPEAALFSKADLTIGGSGALTVRTNYLNGITGKDTLIIEGGILSVTAVNHGIKGKDALIVKGGELTVDAGVDGIKATNDTDTALGSVQIHGGSIQIKAQDEGISAYTDVRVTAGEIRIDTANNGIKADRSIDLSGGTVTIVTGDKGLVTPEQTIGAQADVSVNGERISGS